MSDILLAFLSKKDGHKAIAMASYMKNQFSFLGIPSPLRKQLQKEFLHSTKGEAEIDAVLVLQLWSYEHREFQYLAIDYLIQQKKYLTREHINLIETLIVTKSWWDTVDVLASQLVGQLCSTCPDLVESHILRWAKHENMWLRRTAILYQLRYKEKTDTEILAKVIIHNRQDEVFFIRKAIGWALREYSKVNGTWVKEFIEEHQLSSLSVREGMKHLQRQ